MVQTQPLPFTENESMRKSSGTSTFKRTVQLSIEDQT